MKEKEKEKEKYQPQEGESSRRGFIKAGIAGLAVSAAAGSLSPIARAVTAKQSIAREKSLIEGTVGRAVRILMDPDENEPPDLALIYKELGGKAEFTSQLLADTFGSRSMRKEGIHPLRAHTAPDLTAMTKALEKNAIELVEKKVPAILGQGVKNIE